MRVEVDKEVVAKAILDSLDKDQRDELIQSAIKRLLEERHSTTYGHSGKTYLQEVFEEGVLEAAKEIVREELKKPEVRKALSDAISIAVAKALDITSDSYMGMVNRVSEAVASALAYEVR